MAADLRAGLLNPAFFIEVEDDRHQLLFTLPFSEAYRVKSPTR